MSDSVRMWLRDAAPGRPLKVTSRSKPSTASNHCYGVIGKSIKRTPWTDFTLDQITQLYLVNALLDAPLERDLVSPTITDAELTIRNETGLENVLKQSLVYHVKHALQQLSSGISLLPGVPFASQPWDYNDSNPRIVQQYIPDYTVFLDVDHVDQACLAVGDAKIVGQTEDTLPLSAHLGQILWYCVCQHTRYGFIVSEQEVTAIEFIADSENVDELQQTMTETVSQAEREQSLVPRSFSRSPSANEPQSKRPRN